MRSIRSGAWVLLLLAACAAHGGVNNWTARGPFGGTAYRLAIHPSQPNLAFVVAEQSLYRTTDGGNTWSQLIQQAPFFANYGPIQFDPAHPNRIYATARDSGLWRSTDGGETFVNISPFMPEGTDYPKGLAISADGNTIYYATSAGKFFRSTDGGASFQRGTDITADGDRLVVDPNNSSVVYAGAWSKLMKTEDDGDHWVQLPLPSGTEDFAVTPGSPNILWANASAGVYSKPDDGSPWSLVLPGYAVHSDPAVPSILYAGPTSGVGVVRRFSGGSWTDVAELPSRMESVAILASNPQVVLAGANSGVFRTSNGGASWTRSDNGLDAIHVRHLATGGGRVYASTEHGEIGIGDADEGILQRSRVGASITSIAAHPTDPNIIVAGSHDSGVRYTNDGGVSWNPGPANLAPTRIDAIAFDPQDPQSIYLALSPRATSEAIIQRSTDGGATFTPVGGTGLNDIEATRLVIDPENPARMLLSSLKIGGTNNGLFRSVDGGVTWSKVVPNLNGFDVAIDPDNTNRMYALTGSLLHVSDNGGASFAPLFSYNPSYGSPLSIALDPTVPDIVYVLASNELIRSVDAGISWETLPKGPVRTWYPANVAINAAAPTTVLVGTFDNALQSFEIAPDLEVGILDHADNRGSGAANRFNVRVHNNGPLAATGVALEIRAPAGATDVAAELSGGTCTIAANVVQCLLPFVKLASDPTVRVTYTLPASAQLNVQANVNARERDTVAGNNTATFSPNAPPPSSGGGGGGGGGSSGGGGGGGGGMSLYFMLTLALLALSAPPRRRAAR